MVDKSLHSTKIGYMTFTNYKNTIRVTSEKPFADKKQPYAINADVYAEKKKLGTMKMFINTAYDTRHIFHKKQQLRDYGRNAFAFSMLEYPDIVEYDPQTIKYTALLKNPYRDSKGKFNSFKDLIQKFYDNNNQWEKVKLGRKEKAREEKLTAKETRKQFPRKKVSRKASYGKITVKKKLEVKKGRMEKITAEKTRKLFPRKRISRKK